MLTFWRLGTFITCWNCISCLMIHNWGQVLVYKRQLTYWNVTDSSGLNNHHQHGFSATLALSIKCFKRLSLRIIASKHLLEIIFSLNNLYLLVLCGTWGKRMLYYHTILYYTILYYTILYYTILYYTILYCTVLYCTVLYYTNKRCNAPFAIFKGAMPWYSKSFFWCSKWLSN